MALISSTPGSYVSITKCATYMNKMYGSVQIALQKIREEKRLAGMLGSYVCIACWNWIIKCMICSMLMDHHSCFYYAAADKRRPRGAPLLPSVDEEHGEEEGEAQAEAEAPKEAQAEAEAPKEAEEAEAPKKQRRLVSKKRRRQN